MQSDLLHNAALGDIRQVPNGPTPNGHAPPAASTAPGTGYTQIYHAWMHPMLAKLSDPELRAMLYILRNTQGWSRTSDQISQGQFLHGKENDQLDEGCGIKSIKPLRKAIAGLEAKGYIRVEHAVSARGKTLTTTFTLLLTVPDGVSGNPSLVINGLPDTPSPASDGLPRHPLMGDGVTHDGVSGNPSWVTASPIDGLPRPPTKERKETSKEIDKETAKENALPRAGARAREQGSGPLHPSEGTDPSRKAEAVQTCFSEHLVHGERIAPSAITPSEGGNVTPAPPAGPPADKTKVKSGSISLDLVEGEPVDLAAAKLFLSTVPPGPKGSGWKTAQAHVLEKWRKLLAPLLDDLGPTDYGRWVRYMVGEPWLAEDPQRINWVKEPWLGAAVTTWQNLPPEQQDVPLTVAKADRTERVRERELEKYKDPRKVGSRSSDKDPVHSCLDCASKPGQPHLQGCMIVMKCDPTATVVTMEHCDTHWATPLLAAWNKLHPSKPTYAEDGTPTCCQCAVKVGYKHQFSCAYIRHAGLPMESLVTAEQNDPAHYKAVYAAQKAEQERQIQIERDKARKEQGRD